MQTISEGKEYLFCELAFFVMQFFLMVITGFKVLIVIMQHIVTFLFLKDSFLQDNVFLLLR